MNRVSLTMVAMASVAAMVSMSSCARPPAGDGETEVALSAAVQEETAEPEPAGFQEEYFSLIEGYLDDSVFTTVVNDDTKRLSDLLKGHYDVTGRSDGGDLEYYLAVRRDDAPDYDDFQSIHLGSTDDQFFIGYYDKDSEPKMLYELYDYGLLDMPLGYDNLECFCFSAPGSSNTKENPAFNYAFSQDRRAILDFIKSKPGLSLAGEDQPSIQFYYQDEDTIDFYSEPYPCYIALTDGEQEEVRRQLSASRIEEGIKTGREAMDYLSKMGTVCSTGASLSIDGRRYKCFGNQDLSGYMMVFAEDEFLSLEYNEELYDFITEKIRNAVGMDYGDFDPEWFKVPLKSASIQFPEYAGINGAPADEMRTQTLEDRDKLDALSALMDQAVRRGECGFSACPYAAVIDFTREDGRTLRMFAAVDSCDSISYEGRIGFEYGKQSDLAAIFDDAMAYRLAE